MNIYVPNKAPLISLTPKIALIGEAPGEQEEIQGQPFVGSSGQELDKLLAKHEIIRSGCFIGNIYQFRPPGNNIHAIDKGSDQWKLSISTLTRELAAYAPDITIAFGDTALSALTGRTSITKWRGSLLPNILTGQGKVLPTFHPANFLRQWKNRCIVDFDLGKAKQYGETKDFNLPARHFVINPNFTEVISILKSFHNRPKLAIDFENRIEGGGPLCLGFAPSNDFALCIPFTGWSIEEEKQIWREIARLMRNPNVGKIFHNALHDLFVFAVWMRIVPQNVCMDTMQAWHNCYPELPKSLAFVASILTNQPYYKDMHKESDEGDDEKAWSPGTPKEKLYAYNCTDCCVTFEVAEALEKELDDIGSRTGFERDMAMIPIALGMTLKGMRLDFDRMSYRYAEIESRIESIDSMLDGVFKGVNTKSPKQMKKLLYEDLKLPGVYKFDKKTKESKLTTNEDALLELARKFKTPQLMLLLKNRQLRTEQSFFDIEFGKDFRIHSSFNIGGTETFRWSSSGSFLGGRNLMNIPDGCRDIYVADPGMTLVGFDKAQAEARFVAYKGYICTGDATYKNLVESGEKIHVWFMKRLSERRICPLSIDEISYQMSLPSHQKSEDFNAWYFIAKKAIHAFSYGLGPIRFCKVVAAESDGTVLVETATANKVKTALYESISTIPKWQQAVIGHLRTSRTIVTTFGRCRLFLERWGEDLFGEAYAYEPQATASGDDVNRSILALAEACPNLQVLQQNYDSMLGQVPEGEVANTLEKIKTLCEQPFKVWNFRLDNHIEITIPVVAKVGKNWGDYDTEENPEGMKEVK